MVDSGSALLAGGCIATIIPLIFTSVMVKDRSSRWILLYLCWGTLAGLLAYLGTGWFTAAPGQAHRVVTSAAPVVEEVLKALPLLLFLWSYLHPRVTKLIVYCAMASGVGFSIQESIHYFAASSGAVGDFFVLGIRTITTALMHGMTTAIFGLGLLFLHKQRQILLPVIFGLLSLSITIHALFNLLLPTSLAVVAMLMPVGLYFGGLWLLNSYEENSYQPTEHLVRKDDIYG